MYREQQRLSEKQSYSIPYRLRIIIWQWFILNKQVFSYCYLFHCLLLLEPGNTSAVLQLYHIFWHRALKGQQKSFKLVLIRLCVFKR
jgi:hypothetical protein